MIFGRRLLGGRDQVSGDGQLSAQRSEGSLGQKCDSIRSNSSPAMASESSCGRSLDATAGVVRDAFKDPAPPGIRRPSFRCFAADQLRYEKRQETKLRAKAQSHGFQLVLLEQAGRMPSKRARLDRPGTCGSVFRLARGCSDSNDKDDRVFPRH
jgi:hypothetical protein